MGYRHTSNPTSAALIHELLASPATLFSRSELRQLMDEQVRVDDALALWERHGLVHRLEDAQGREFFWPTRACLASEETLSAIGSLEVEAER